MIAESFLAQFKAEPIDETPAQRECAILSHKICAEYQAMRDTADRNAKGQHAHDVLVYYRILKCKRPSWVDSANRFLISNDYFVGADVRRWANQAWVVFSEWHRASVNASNEKRAGDRARLERINEQARGGFEE